MATDVTHGKVYVPGLLAASSMASNQWKVVKHASTAGQFTLVNATTDLAIGILEDTPAAGQPGLICAMGVTKAIAGANDLAVGEVLGYNTTAQVADHTTDNRRSIGEALEASTAVGDIVKVLLKGRARY